jgi:23S rRNA (pseudouridine1915-N3)-methyltransferase
MMDSVELSQTVEKLAVSGVSHIYFVIGGSLGLSDEVLRRADLALSFSKMTFPHQLMRVILLEQIYRSYRIINGEPYHK